MQVRSGPPPLLPFPWVSLHLTDVPRGTFSGVFGTQPTVWACSRWDKSEGNWNAAPQPGLKKKCELKGGISAGYSPVGPPSGSAAKSLSKYGIHVHPSGIQKADRSLVNAPMGPWPDPAPDPRSEFRLPFFQVRVEPDHPQECSQPRLRVPFACLFHATPGPKVPFLQVLRFPVHGCDISSAPDRASKQFK